MSGGAALSRRLAQASMRLKYAVMWLGARAVKGHPSCSAGTSVLGLSSRVDQASESRRRAANAVLVEQCRSSGPKVWHCPTMTAVRMLSRSAGRACGWQVRCRLRSVGSEASAVWLSLSGGSQMLAPLLGSRSPLVCSKCDASVRGCGILPQGPSAPPLQSVQAHVPRRCRARRCWRRLKPLSSGRGWQ